MLGDVGQIATSVWHHWRTGRVVEARFNDQGSLVLDEAVLDGRDIIIRSRDDAGSIDEFVTFDTQSHISRYSRYRPLVYFTSYAEHLFPMLSMALTSLTSFGRYKGDILIVTDKDEEFVRNFIPNGLSNKFHIWHHPVSDVLDISCARYRVPLWQSSIRYQPLLYMDTDVIVDAPVEPVLLQIASQAKLCFQGEASHQLSTSVGVGSRRFESAGINVEGETGYNSGIMGIPKIPFARADLNCIVEGTYRYAAACGTRMLEWYDQATGNYILHELDGAEQNILFSTVRWGSRNALHGGAKAKGFVHLWGASNKEEEMRDLLRMMQGLPREDDAPWIVYDKGLRLELPYMGESQCVSV